MLSDRSAAVDVNECNDEPCSVAGSNCKNSVGGYQCVCGDGEAPENGTCARNPCDNADCQGKGWN